MMLARHTIHDVCSIITARDYYQPAHEAIHNAIVELDRKGSPVDPVTVAAELGADLQRVGGPLYLHDLTSRVTVPSSAPHHAQLVAGKALQRRLVEAGQQVSQMGYTTDDPMRAAQDARQVVDQAALSVSTTEGGASLDESLEATIDYLENEPVGADTPWEDVNDRTNGLLAGQMITVAARPGHGKSLVLKDVALFTAKQGKPVHIATLEMSRAEYMTRILSAEAKVPLSNMLARRMSEGEWARIADAADTLRGLPLYLDDRESQSMAQIRAAARQTSRRYGKPLGLIGIDYAQLVRPADMRQQSREQQVAQISRDTKLTAKEFHCPTMLLAQLNRKNQERAGHIPMVSDLRESGSLEQDSDKVWLLHRPDQYDMDDRPGELELIVGKNRNGPAVSIALAFQGHYARVVSLA